MPNAGDRWKQFLWKQLVGISKIESISKSDVSYDTTIESISIDLETVLGIHIIIHRNTVKRILIQNSTFLLLNVSCLIASCIICVKISSLSFVCKLIRFNEKLNKLEFYWFDSWFSVVFVMDFFVPSLVREECIASSIHKFWISTSCQFHCRLIVFYFFIRVRITKCKCGAFIWIQKMFVFLVDR